MSISVSDDIATLHQILVFSNAFDDLDVHFVVTFGFFLHQSHIGAIVIFPREALEFAPHLLDRVKAHRIDFVETFLDIRIRHVDGLLRMNYV